MAGLAEMYQDYIDGIKEIRDINMEFRAQYESGIEAPDYLHVPEGKRWGMRDIHIRNLQ